MPKYCKCGGRYYPAWETSTAFAVRCDKCGVRKKQHKRRKKEAW